ncbi:MAG: aminoacyl-tRNA hydrolase [Candidatus Saccharimonadales bacterium]
MKLIVGLGNIGKNYQKNRHNIGFMVLDSFAAKQEIAFKNDAKNLADVVKLSDAWLIKPTTMMNSSGQAVRKMADYYNIDPKDILVIYDELALPFGTIRARLEGSSAGHNGIKSIISHLGSDEFKRIRIGIHNDKADKQPTTKFVLSNFSRKEAKELDKILDQTDQLIIDFIKTGKLAEDTFKI